MIKGCVGFSHIEGRFIGYMILVKGQRTISVSLPWPVYVILKRLWRSKNILGNFLFEKSTDFRKLEEYRKAKEMANS